MNPRDTSGCRQNPSPITKSRRLEESKSRSPFFRSLLGFVEVAINVFVRSIVRDLNGPIVSARRTIWVELPVAAQQRHDATTQSPLPKMPSTARLVSS